jgi:sugar lactone lactonase YvrE
MRKTLWMFASAALALALLGGSMPAAAQPAQTFPDVINLPNGWLPEGVVTGKGPVIYAGSRRNGAIYAADLRTGEGKILVPGVEGRIAVGLSFDPRSNYIFAAGGVNGNAFVYDAESGAEVGAYQFASAPTFVNDVIVTQDAAYFTDSQKPVFYRLPLGPGGSLPAAGGFETVPLSGDYVQAEGFNSNGIEATPKGTHLIIVQSGTGLLFNVDSKTGVATTIDLGGYSVSNGDGLLREGRRLYVVRNRSNLIAEINLAPDFKSGTLANEISSPNFDVPTTVARFGSGLYAVNARFSTPPEPTTTYTIVRVER